MEERATYEAMLSIYPGKRPFIISRSTFAGAGKWAGHWVRVYLRYRSHMGPDFPIPIPCRPAIIWPHGSPCATPSKAFSSSRSSRSQWWALTHAASPVTRTKSSATDGCNCPHLRHFTEITMLGAPSRRSLTGGTQLLRLAVLPSRSDTLCFHTGYDLSSPRRGSSQRGILNFVPCLDQYTLFANASLNGSPVVRALFFEFPDEPELFDVDRQFMIGSDILVTPVLEPSADSVQGESIS